MVKTRSVKLPADLVTIIEELRVVNGYNIPITEVIRKALTDLYDKSQKWEKSNQREG